MIKIEVLTIGDELLLGHTIDTNSAFIGRELSAAGYRITHRATVGDDSLAIANAVGNALDRADVVICTGGLGPTQDDFTKPVVARLFNTPLEVDPSIVEQLKERYARRGIAMPERNVSQAEVPRGAQVLPNSRGTAPGLVLTDSRGRHCIMLPGVPHEMRGLVLEQVLPFLSRLEDRNAEHGVSPICYRVLRTTGIAESLVAEKLDGLLAELKPLTLAFLPNFAGTDLRLTCWGQLHHDEANRALDAGVERIRAVLSEYIYGSGDADLSAVVGDLLRNRKLTIATAESCTGGLVAKRLTDIPGSSAYVIGGVIAYSDRVKTDALGVPAALIAEHGAVSEQAVRAMATGARDKFGADTAIAITGVAGPSGGSDEKPIGTVWLAAAADGGIEARRVVLPGDREEIRERAAQAGLALLWKMIR